MCCVVLAGAMLPVLPACLSPRERVRVYEQNESLRRDVERLQREVAQRDGRVAQLQRQVEDLQRFGPDRPADLFAPVTLDIASLSGGRDYDGTPGDDGVTVYLRPRDADGDAVKAPGRISVQLLDNTNLSAPRVLALKVFDDPEELRKLWHGRFATDHYTLKCPFPPDVELPASRRVTVSAEFTDYLTGATLTAVKEVPIAFPEKTREGED